jgi:hypothetical protein
MQEHKHDNSYRSLFIMAVISFASMYVLMYAMVDRFANVIPNINQFYMAGLMAAPMIVIEIILMRQMYKNKKLNILILAGSVVLLGVFFACIRLQTGVSDKQFLKSMIPHHAAAVLMCKETKIEDAEIKQLCSNIVSGQQQEIDQMKTILERLK